jgi:thymidylate synthase
MAQDNYLDLLRTIMEQGTTIYPRGQECREMSDVPTEFDLLSPFLTFAHRAYDISYFKKEFRWKLTADKYDTSIQDHATMWRSIINPDGTYNSQYGQYFFGPGHNIFDVVTELIRDPYSRRAVIPMLNVSHMHPSVVDTVCTESIGFRIRDGRLDMSIHMRSSDVVFGLGTDVPTFAFLYRLVLGLLHMDLVLGTMAITSMSSHIYERHYKKVEAILDNPEYGYIYMPFCDYREAMKIISSRGNKEILKTAGPLGEWLCQD